MYNEMNAVIFIQIIYGAFNEIKFNLHFKKLPIQTSLFYSAKT